MNWVFGPGPSEGPGHLWPRWLFLRALGLIFFSAFYSLLFQIHGLIGPEGILPAGEYLERVGEHFGTLRFWFAPTLLWFGTGSNALSVLCWSGLVGSVLLILNLWPRGAIAACLVAYLSFIAAAEDFASYQSDGMLLATGFVSLVFAPPGFRPRLGAKHPPSRATLFLLLWEWFRIYFESGLVKMLSHDQEWRSLTALDHYYENGPLPNWIGWYVQQLPHGFHAVTTFATLAMELGVVWLAVLPRRFRLVCFLLVTPFQVAIILTANLAFINHLSLSLGVLLLDDQFLKWVAGLVSARIPMLGRGAQPLAPAAAATPVPSDTADNAAMPVAVPPEVEAAKENSEPNSQAPAPQFALLESGSGPGLAARWSLVIRHSSLAMKAFMLSWIFYVSAAYLVLMLIPGAPVWSQPIVALEPFRIANQYGLFAVMTRARYEIEFQGTRDGVTWTPYPFKYKPQDPHEAPGFYAPYQPRFDWNLWFASLGNWREYEWVVLTEVRLLENSPSVLRLFRGNPFSGGPPRAVRAVVWQYWFTNLETKRRKGLWWDRKLVGLYAPAADRLPDGSIGIVTEPGQEAPSPGPP